MMEGELGSGVVQVGRMNFLPEDQFHSGGRPEEGEDFDSERRENEIGVASHSQGDPRGGS